MRFTKFSIIIAYVMALLALVLFVASWFHAGEPAFAGWLVGQGCFLLLASIWVNVCS
ncbi:MAG: hypothetical protein IKE55_03265 [Kiritimatiellae bacterium]|nr:hypothetical protein [Kiritimatiellia bacterium]